MTILVTIAVLTAIVVAVILAEIAGRLARIVLVGALRLERTPTSYASPIVRRPYRIIRFTVFLAALAALALPALDLAGIDTPAQTSSAALRDWFFGSGLRIVLITVLAYVVVRFIGAIAVRLEADLSQLSAPDAVEQLKRARTLSGLVRKALTVVVVGLAVLMTLRELRIDIVPILTGAGIVGLAVGFGAQTLVKDLIAGFFLTLENQIRVGDVARINGTGGLVEEINLRTIVLRDAEGIVHIFPNGSIVTLANLTKDYSYFVLDVGVSYKEQIDVVIEVLRAVGAELAKDPKLAPAILAPLEVLGVESFTETQLTIRVRIKTLPLKQWEVGRELRRRVKNAFDERGIVLPATRVSVHVGETAIPPAPPPMPQAPPTDAI